jgi:hypothetical protein
MANGRGRDGGKSSAGMLVDGLGRSAVNRITDRSQNMPGRIHGLAVAAALKFLIIICHHVASPYDRLGDWKGGGLPRLALAP